MDIIIRGSELSEAMEAWVNKLGMNTTGKHVEVSFTSGRGVNASSATVSITSEKNPNPGGNTLTNTLTNLLLDNHSEEDTENNPDMDSDDSEEVKDTKPIFGTS